MSQQLIYLRDTGRTWSRSSPDLFPSIRNLVAQCGLTPSATGIKSTYLVWSEQLGDDANRGGENFDGRPYDSTA